MKSELQAQPMVRYSPMDNQLIDTQGSEMFSMSSVPGHELRTKGGDEEILGPSRQLSLGSTVATSALGGFPPAVPAPPPSLATAAGTEYSEQQAGHLAKPIIRGQWEQSSSSSKPNLEVLYHLVRCCGDCYCWSGRFGCPALLTIKWQEHLLFARPCWRP